VCFFDLVVGKARLRYRSLLLTTNFKVALQVESTIVHCPASAESCSGRLNLIVVKSR
jgi:hypothetical protein